jgi:hypothetical protein
LRGPAPYFTNYVEQQLIDRYGSGRVFGGGLRVNTTIDLDVQRIARQAITKWLTDPNGPSAALVAVDPRNGKVLAMIGGNNYRKSQFNLAVQGERSRDPRSSRSCSRRPLKDGISPDSEFESGPVQIPLGDKVWYVHNYENSDLGRISLATATEVSDNTVYAQLTQLVGPGAIVRTAKKLGISSPLKNYFAIGLGAEAGQPARNGARLLRLRQRRAADRRRRLRQPSTGDLGRPERGWPDGRQQPAGPPARPDREHGGARHLAAAGRRACRYRQARAALGRAARRRQDGHHRELRRCLVRSGTRRSWSRRSGSAIRRG